jgi:hypothetical protein
VEKSLTEGRIPLMARVGFETQMHYHQHLQFEDEARRIRVYMLYISKEEPFRG